MIELYTLDFSAVQGRQKLREQFYKNAHARDPRVVDMLVIKVKRQQADVKRLYCQALLLTPHVHIPPTGKIGVGGDDKPVEAKESCHEILQGV